MPLHTNYYFDDSGVYADSFPANDAAVAPPDNALWIAPPGASSVPEGHVIMVKPDKSGWQIVPDYRGRGAWNPDGIWEQIWKPGPLPDGWSETPPPPSPEVIAAQEAQQAQSQIQQELLDALPDLIAAVTKLNNGDALTVDEANKLASTAQKASAMKTQIAM